MISKIKYEFLLIYIALIVSLILIFVMQINYQTYVFGDSNSYILAAKEFYLHRKLNDYRPLIITLINGLPLIIGFQEYSLFIWSLIVNYTCWLGTILLIYKIGGSYFSKKKSFVIALFFIGCMGNFFIVFHLLSETIFIFFLTFCIYFLVLFNQKKQIKYLISCSSLLIIISMIKPLAIGILFILILFYIKEIKNIFFSRYIIILFLSLTVLCYQLIKMKQEYGNYTISYIDGVTYYNYLGTRADCLKNKVVFEQGKNERVINTKNVSVTEMKELAKKDLRKQLLDNTQNLGEAYLINLYINSTKGSASVHACKNVKQTSYFNFFALIFKALTKIQNIFFSLLGVVMAVYFLLSKSTLFTKFVSTIILYIILISGVSSDQGDRFHIVFYPMVLLLISFFLATLTRLRQWLWF